MAGLIEVANDEVATVVTSLVMTTRPPARPLPSSPLRLARWSTPDPERYRILFRRVGGPWLWFSRLAMDDAALTAIVHDQAVQLYAVLDAQGIEVGMVELDFRTSDRCDIVYFGLVPELAGRGHGRWLMAETLAHAWLPGIQSVAVNTCSLDHPTALGFYRAQGFVPVKRIVETFVDPRARGLLPPDAAPQIPYLANRR